MTNEEIEAARIEQGVPEGSLWMGDGWCLPDTVKRLTDAKASIEAEMALRKADPNKANCYCFSVSLDRLPRKEKWAWMTSDPATRHEDWENVHDPEDGTCYVRRKQQNGGDA